MTSTIADATYQRLNADGKTIFPDREYDMILQTLGRLERPASAAAVPASAAAIASASSAAAAAAGAVLVLHVLLVLHLFLWRPGQLWRRFPAAGVGVYKHPSAPGVRSARKSYLKYYLLT